MGYNPVYDRYHGGSGCTVRRAKCGECGRCFDICRLMDQKCPDCHSLNIAEAPWWYGQEIPKNEIFSKTLKDGRKIVPEFYVDVRIYLHPIGGRATVLEWFENQGYAVVSNDEWYSYDTWSGDWPPGTERIHDKRASRAA